MRPVPVRVRKGHPIEKVAVATLAGLALAGGPAGGIIGAAPNRPKVTIRVFYAPRLKNILFHGILLPARGEMLESIAFRLESGRPGHWQVASNWMALVTGVRAHWSPNGHYTGGLMQMNAPVGPGTYRVELRAIDDNGGATVADSNVLRVR